MSKTLNKLKSVITQALSLDQLGFSYPPNNNLGELSLSFFDLAKSTKENPAKLAAEAAKTLNNSPKLKDYFQEIAATGPYLNFTLKPSFLAESLLTEIKATKHHYGQKAKINEAPILIEYSNGNTHKEYHIGHLRNISYGAAVNQLLLANGRHSIPISYLNDFGIHVAKTIWHWKNSPKLQASQENKGYLLGHCYSEASKKLVEHPEDLAAVLKIMTNIEQRQGADYELWQETRRWSIDYFNSIYQELGIKFDHTFYENECLAEGLEIVKNLKSQGILTLSDGAIIANLESSDLGVLPIIRSGGTALYPVADLALMSQKERRYQPQESIYVVDVRQSLYFKQLAKLAELMGHQTIIRHLAYDFVTLPDGLMSSRSGNIITYQELRDQIYEKLTEETKRRHPEWSTNRVHQVAWQLSLATIKFEMLKVGADKIITFNLTEALRFDGYTACYLLYSYVRLQSLINKAPFIWPWTSINYSLLKTQKEKALLMKLARYPETISLAGERYNPTELTKYLFELAQLTNDYYHETNILKTEPKARLARLALIKGVSQVLANGFKILGLPLVTEM